MISACPSVLCVVDQEGMLAQIHKSKARSETMLLDTFAGNKPSDEVDIWRCVHLLCDHQPVVPARGSSSHGSNGISV